MKYGLNDLQRLLRQMVLALLLPWLSACHGESSFPSKVIGYNHTDKDIGYFTVQIGESQGGSGYLEAHHGGGSWDCCVSIPNPWRPGLTATVGWSDDYAENYQEREVPIPEYDVNQVGRVSVHFLRNGEIKIFMTMYALWHPDYPLKGEEAELTPGVAPKGPWDK